MSLSKPQVRVGVAALILRSPADKTTDPSFLVGERINSHGAGTWATPGGHLEFGETPESCAAREVAEETGLQIKNARFLTATNDIMPDEGKHYVTFFMICEREDDLAEPRVLEPDKCAGWEWISWSTFLELVKAQSEARDGADVKKKLFLPMLDLISQRGHLVPWDT